MSISLQQQAKVQFQNKLITENNEFQRRQKLLRMPINSVPFHKVIEEFCNKQIDLKSDYDSEIISRLLQLEQKSRKEIQALQKAFGNLKFFMEAYEYLAKKEFEGLLQEVKYEKFDKFQKVFDFGKFILEYGNIYQQNSIIMNQMNLDIMFVQIPNKNYKKYEDKNKLTLDVRQSSIFKGVSSKASSRNNSSDSSTSSISSNSSHQILNTSSKYPNNQKNNKSQVTRNSIRNELKNYFQFQDQGNKNQGKPFKKMKLIKSYFN